MTNYIIVLKNGNILEGYNTLQGCLSHVAQLKSDNGYGVIEIKSVFYGGYLI